MIVNGSRIIGPALAGALFYTVGLAAPFLVNAGSYFFVIGALLAMRTAELQPAPHVAREPGQLRAGFRYVWQTPQLLLPLAIMAVVGTLGYNFSVILPLMAKEVFGRGAETYSVLTTAMGIGALAGGLIAASRRRPTRRLLIGATIAFGLSSIAVAYAPTLDAAIALLRPHGRLLGAVRRDHELALQLNAEPAMRGRVMSLWAVVFLGSTPIGSPLTGSGRLCLGAALRAGRRRGDHGARRRRGVRGAAGAGARAAGQRPQRPNRPSSRTPSAHCRTCLPDDVDESEAFDDLREAPPRRAAGSDSTV